MSRTFATLLTVVVALAAASAQSALRGASNSADLVLPAKAGKNGEPVALLFAQGAEIAPEAYRPFLEALQDSVPFPLWAAVPACTGNVAVLGLDGAIKRVDASLAQQGMPANVSYFYGGHSLGGAFVQDIVAKLSSDSHAAPKGLVLMGSFITRKYRTGATPEGRPQYEYPVPVLTIGAELDGLCRITRIAEARHNQIDFDADPTSALRAMPVTVVAGASHAQFASGTMPSFVKSHDLRPEISDEAARAVVVSDTHAFMAAVQGDEAQWAGIESRAADSATLLAPLVEAMQLEGYAQFLPGCYCETPDEYGGLQYGTCVSGPNCTGGVPWTSTVAQGIMGARDGLTIRNVDSIHKVTEERPSCHLPHIHKGTAGDGTVTPNADANANPGNGVYPPLCDSPEGCTLDVTSVTQQLYSTVDVMAHHFNFQSLDTGFSPVTADELRVKMKSRQAIWQAAGVANVSFTDTDAATDKGGKSELCGAINQAAIDYALKHASPAAAARYARLGQKLVVGPDVTTCPAGPCWIYAALDMKADDDAGIVNVISKTFPSKNKRTYPCGEGKLLPCSAGFHYCKALSPARALEWMYVDGLRLKDGL